LWSKFGSKSERCVMVTEMSEWKAVWGYESSSSSRIYTVRLNKDGNLSCNCPSWIYRRTCRRVKDMEAKLSKANVGLSKREQRKFYHLYKKNLEK